MRRGFLGAIAAGAAMAASAAASVVGAVTNQRAERRREKAKRRQRSRARYQGWGWIHARYTPHQGAQEIARRRRQIETGKLQFFVPGVTADARRFEPTSKPAAEAPVRRKRRTPAEMVAARAAGLEPARKPRARKVEAANG